MEQLRQLYNLIRLYSSGPGGWPVNQPTGDLVKNIFLVSKSYTDTQSLLVRRELRLYQLSSVMILGMLTWWVDELQYGHVDIYIHTIWHNSVINTKQLLLSLREALAGNFYLLSYKLLKRNLPSFWDHDTIWQYISNKSSIIDSMFELQNM